jgi:hypothetical protein
VQRALIKPATEFFIPIIVSVPWHLCMMGNNIRAEGKAKFAMVA